MEFAKFIVSRFITFFLVVYIGVTAVFFLPRLMPSDPVENVLHHIHSQAGFMDPELVDEMRRVLNENFGLEGTLLEQYGAFLRRAIFTQDFGPSFSSFPTPVVELIGRALPWTLGLLLTTTLISFFIGNLIGLFAGYRSGTFGSKLLEWIAMVIYPIPFFVVALLMSMFFSYMIPIFPLVTSIFAEPWTIQWVREVIWSSMLPAISLTLLGLGWWVLSMRTLTQDIAEEDYVTFARQKGLSDARIMTRYIYRNAIPSQTTILALRIGAIFSGSMLTEIIFSYPGIGTLTFRAIQAGDYNLILGTITMSIISVSLAAFLIDIFYPLLDPRVRCK